MLSETPTTFHRRRIAAMSQAIGAWHKCPRAACRRAGQCKGADQILPPCLPTVIGGMTDSIAECIAALPGAAPRPPSRAKQVEDTIWDIQLRMSTMMSRMLTRMEKKESGREGRATPA